MLVLGRPIGQKGRPWTDTGKMRTTQNDCCRETRFPVRKQGQFPELQEIPYGK